MIGVLRIKLSFYRESKGYDNTVFISFVFIHLISWAKTSEANAGCMFEAFTGDTLHGKRKPHRHNHKWTFLFCFQFIFLSLTTSPHTYTTHKQAHLFADSSGYKCKSSMDLSETFSTVNVLKFRTLFLFGSHIKSDFCHAC